MLVHLPHTIATRRPQLLDAVVPEPGMQLQVPAAQPTPKQETVTRPLNLCQNS